MKILLYLSDYELTFSGVMSIMEFAIMGGSLILGLTIGLTICSIYRFYEWIKNRKNLNEWHKRTEISDQDIDSIIKRLIETSE